MRIPIEQVNQFVLQKHHLTYETKSDNIVQIIQNIGGLHATRATTPYLSLFIRTRTFTRNLLHEELYTKKTLGKIRWVRKTVYILPQERISVAFSATRSMIVPLSEKFAKYFGITHKEYQEIANQILTLLQGKEMTVTEIKGALETDLNIGVIVNLMCDAGWLLRWKPRKGWKSNLHTYIRFDECFPVINSSMIEQREAKKEVVEWYLTAFGPVTEEDITWWTGFKKSDIRQSLSDLEGKLGSLSIAGFDEEYLMLSSQKPALLKTKVPTIPVVNIFPVLDPYLMGYKVRNRYLDSEDYEYIFDRSGNATSTITMNGRIVGIWDIQNPYIKLFLFDHAKKRSVEKIHQQIMDISRFIIGKTLKTKTCRSMISLRERTAGGFMSPLRFS
jgi:hypothetical protein